MLGIVNSDARMNMVYQQLKNRINCVLLDDLSTLTLSFDAILLPMSGLKEDDTMNIRGIDVHCSEEFFSMLKEDGILICGNCTPKLKQLSYKLIDLNEIESFININSKLTAEGVLYLLIDNTNCSLDDLSVDLIGYGHSGHAIYEILRSLNVNARVIRREVKEKSSNFISVDEYMKCIPSKVIINTSITNIIDDLMMKKMDENLIINIVRSASFNEALLRQRHCRIVHAGPLPAIFASKSAADILTQTILEILYEN